MGERQIEIGGGGMEIERKKRRMLDTRVITGKETERGKEEKVQLEKKRGLESGGKKHSCHATRLQ